MHHKTFDYNIQRCPTIDDGKQMMNSITLAGWAHLPLSHSAVISWDGVSTLAKDQQQQQEEEFEKRREEKSWEDVRTKGVIAVGAVGPKLFKVFTPRLFLAWASQKIPRLSMSTTTNSKEFQAKTLCIQH